MRGKKKKSIEDLETELEQLITNSGQSKDDIHTNYDVHLALRWRIDNPSSCHDDDDIWQMKDLHDVFLLGMAICRRQNKIDAARKVASTAAATAAAAPTAAAAAITTSNVANTSIISSYATSVDSSASTSIDCNKITASLDINSLSNQSSILALHSINEITASFEANASFALSTSHLNASDSSIVGGAQPSKTPSVSITTI
jgi:hypothetical protein